MSVSLYLQILQGNTLLSISSNLDALLGKHSAQKGMGLAVTSMQGLDLTDDFSAQHHNPIHAAVAQAPFLLRNTR
jgi:hypothetical protein